MKIRKKLHQLALAARDREPEGKWHMLVVKPFGEGAEMRPPGIYAESATSATYVYEGAEPEPRMMLRLSQLMRDGITVICERSANGLEANDH